MIVVDTTVWVDYLRGARSREVEWLEQNLERERLGLTDLILCEVLQGTRNASDFRVVERALSRFEIFATGGIELAVEAAANFQKLRSEGATVGKTIDCLIATFCIEADHALLHSDRDFDPFERWLGLAVVHS